MILSLNKEELNILYSALADKRDRVKKDLEKKGSLESAIHEVMQEAIEDAEKLLTYLKSKMPEY